MLMLGNKVVDTAALGIGLAFPLREDPATGDFRRASGETNVVMCVKGLVLTRLGERVMAEDVGVEVSGQLFEPQPGALDALPVQLATALLRHEPRLLQPQITVRAEGTATVATIKARIRATGQTLDRAIVLGSENG